MIKVVIFLLKVQIQQTEKNIQNLRQEILMKNKNKKADVADLLLLIVLCFKGLQKNNLT